MFSPLTKSDLWRRICTVALVVLMTLAAGVLEEPEVIFPEVGALCIGLWVLNKRVWKIKRWQIPVLFTVAAVVGILLAHLPIMLPLKLMAAFLFVALLMLLMNVSMSPAISACMLPVLMGTTSWVYPVTVLALSLILAYGQRAMELLGWRSVSDVSSSSHTAGWGFLLSEKRWRRRLLLRWFLLLAIFAPFAFGLYFLSGVSGFEACRLAMVPPLVVTLVEFSNSASGFRKRPVGTWLMIVACALIGTLCEGVLHQLWSIPQALTAALDAILVLLLFGLRGKYFAPAMALSLVPMIVTSYFDGGAVYVYPLYVALGAAYFIIMARLCFIRKDG